VKNRAERAIEKQAILAATEGGSLKNFLSAAGVMPWLSFPADGLSVSWRALFCCA